MQSVSLGLRTQKGGVVTGAEAAERTLGVTHRWASEAGDRLLPFAREHRASVLLMPPRLSQKLVFQLATRVNISEEISQIEQPYFKVKHKPEVPIVNCCLLVLT